MTKLSLRDTLFELAGPDGARICWDSENYAYLYKPVPQPSREVLDELLNYGWLTPAPFGPGMELSREGYLAFMRSTDEMGDGKLVRPFETLNQNPGSPHPESANTSSQSTGSEKA